MEDGQKLIEVAWCIFFPVLGYIVMKMIVAGANNAEKRKAIIYLYRSVEGERVPEIAKSYKKIGKIFFFFTICLSVLNGLILYKNW